MAKLNHSVLILLFPALLACPASVYGLTILEMKGEQIYMTGSTADKSYKAYIGSESDEVPSAMVPCVNCHGPDGQGKPEGGVVPSRITWRHLFKPYGHHHQNQRKHKAFDQASLAISIRQGIDPSGNSLASSMPRYDFPDDTMDALFAYLKHLDSSSDAGIDDASITFGTLLPLQGENAETGKAMSEVIQAFFDQINASGGIYNRKLLLKIYDSSGDADMTLKNAVKLIEKEEVFAFFASKADGIELQLDSLLAKRGIPHIAPYSYSIPRSVDYPSTSFYLLAGINDQVQVLLEYAINTLNKPRSSFAMIVANQAYFQEIADSADLQVRKSGWINPKRATFSDHRSLLAKISELRNQAIDIVLFLGMNNEFESFINAIRSSHWRPYLLLMAPLVDIDPLLDLPDFKDRVWLAYPTWSSDFDPKAQLEFYLLSQTHHLSKTRMFDRIFSYSAVNLLIEGLKRAGQKLSRYGLIQALESIQNYSPGLTPSLSFKPNLRLGTQGAYVMTLDYDTKQPKLLQEFRSSH